MRKLSIITYFIFSALLSPTIVMADANAPIARVEHRPIQHPNFPAGQINHSNLNQYHPAARDEARHDLNNAAETNALNNAAGAYGGVAQPVPVYPTNAPTTNTNPISAPSSGNNVNVYSVPQSGAPTPQH